MDDSFDDDVAMAMALSLSESSKSQPIVISDDDDDDSLSANDSDGHFDADLRKALKASKATSSSTVSQGRTEELPTAQDAGTSSFISERAQMEAARLARQKRYFAETGGSATREERPVKRQKVSSSSSQHAGTGLVFSGPSSSTPASQPLKTGPEAFWEGEIRHTANKHVESYKDRKPTFRLSQLLGETAELVFAILSSYSTDISWIYSFFPPTLPVVLVNQPDEEGNRSIKTILPNWIKVTPFLANGRGCMHMKFLLLFYKTGRLRVVISTANLIDYDWRDIENTIWAQDIPLRKTPLSSPKAKIHEFPSRFQSVLESLNVRPALALHMKDFPSIPLKSITDLGTKWDWSKVKVKLIPSIAGKHESWPSVMKVGLTALMKAVDDFGGGCKQSSKKGKQLVLECQGSSIGTYSTSWMNDFYDCAIVRSTAGDWLDLPKGRRAKLPYPPVKIIFPSLKTVNESVLGPDGGGTMFCRANQWHATKFPRELFHDANSKRGRVLMHSKMIIGLWREKNTIIKAFSGNKGKSARDVQDTDSETETESDSDIEIVEKNIAGWVYMGSHNFTPSAWGTLSGSGFTPMLNIVNYELGIVIPLSSDPEQAEKQADDLACWQRPPRKYTASDLPWMQDTQ